MYRQSTSRNHRSKGFKVKHVLQICVLVAVCFWLIYQVTRSNDKKKEFDHNDVKISEDAQKDDGILKFGRKDLNPQVNKKAKDTEKHGEEVEEEIVEEEDEKHEEEIVEEEEDMHEEDQKEDHETQTKEVESREGGNVEEDEHNQEKPDPDVDRKEFMDGEKEIEEEGEKESEEKDMEDNDRQTETENSLEDHDHDKEIRNTREEHYKGDDASSAVTHGLPVNTENENGSVENHANTVDHENKGNITEESYVGQNTTEFKLQETTETESGTLTVEEKGDDVDSTFEGSSSLNSTTASGSNDKPESSNDSVISDTSYSQNVTGGTVSSEGSNFQSLPLEQTDNSSIVVDNNSQMDSNLTTSNASENVEGNTTWPSNSVTNSHLVASEYSTQSNVSAETKDDSESHNTELKTVARTDGDYESSDSNNTENTDEVQHDNFDSSESSIPLDKKGIHVDLDTLPDIRTEGINSEEAAEE